MFINTRQPFLLSTILRYMRQRDKIRDKILAYRYCNETLIDNLRLVRCRWNLTRSGWVPHRPGVSISDFIRLARPICGDLCKSRGSPRRSERGTTFGRLLRALSWLPFLATAIIRTCHISYSSRKENVLLFSRLASKSTWCSATTSRHFVKPCSVEGHLMWNFRWGVKNNLLSLRLRLHLIYWR